MSLRFIIPLTLTLGLIAYAVVPLVDALTLRWFQHDISTRSQLVASTMQDSLIELIEKDSRSGIQRLFNRVVQDERIYALGLCGPTGHLLNKTDTFPPSLSCAGINPQDQVIQLAEGPLYVSATELTNDGQALGRLIVIHDLSFVQRRTSATKAYIFYLFAAMGLIISLLTVLIAHLSWKGWINGMRAMLHGEGILRPLVRQTSPELRPIVKDLRTLIRDLDSDRRARDESQITWNPQALRHILEHDLSGEQVIVVSNREPYIHVHRHEKIEIQFPASGLVTALEPIMRACSGTWIAHGSGDADRETVDAHDRVPVPPGEPSYQLKRIWLTKEEEKGYYYGFANEGIWALCHIAHVRPVFRSQDWDQYVAVNAKFAQAVIDEAKDDDPVVLVQDYHLALVPKMIKEHLPKATIITFWHIPFPNPEVFGVCPWREQLLDGLLGSSILGFHTRFHCHNFMDSVDRFLESRIDKETSTVSYKGHSTEVKSYPISIEYPSKWVQSQKSIRECRERIRRINGLSAQISIGVGVDRLDYTKGILERFMAVERLLELQPEWIGKFTFIQIAAPSRSSIESYQRFRTEVEILSERINRRFGRDGYVPILLKIEHHEPQDVYEYYRGADLCFVSSLHDGMNLVAKEFIAARDDERGVIILSQFTGASRELPESLIVNPYDIDQCAAALGIALTMPDREQRDRMRSMRGLIQEFNVYRWAGRMLLDASRIRRRTRLFESSSQHSSQERKKTVSP